MPKLQKISGWHRNTIRFSLFTANLLSIGIDFQYFTASPTLLIHCHESWATQGKHIIEISQYASSRQGQS